MRKRDRDVGKIEHKALEGENVSYTEVDNKYLVYVTNARKVAAIQDVIIEDFVVGPTPDNTESPELLVGWLQQLGIWHTVDGHQDNGNIEKHCTSLPKKR